MTQHNGTRWMVAVAMVAASIGFGTYMSARATALTPAPPAVTKVATVELEAVIQKLKEREDREKALENEQKAVEDHLNSLKNELKAMQTKVENEPDGPNKLAMAKDLSEKVDRSNFEVEFSAKRLGRLRGEAFAELFKHIESACREVAKKSGYDIVLTSDEKVSIRPDPDTVLRNIALKRILYANPELDITQQVVDFMNNQYAAGPKATVGSGTKP